MPVERPSLVVVGRISSPAAQVQRSAQIVDKLLDGARPADIPVEQATVFELAVNVKTARALGIKMPQSVLLRANKVIE